MKTALVSALQESCGYLRDEGWHQTAQLMTLAGSEIERLTERVRELEAERETAPGASSTGALRAPHASNQNGVPAAAVSSRR